STNDALISECAKYVLNTDEFDQLVVTSSTTATLSSLASATSNIDHNIAQPIHSSSVNNHIQNSLITEQATHFKPLETISFMPDVEEVEEINCTEDDHFTNMPSEGQPLSSLIQGGKFPHGFFFVYYSLHILNFPYSEQTYYEENNNTTQVQPCTHDQVYLDGPDGSCAIDLDSPECIERANQMRLLQFYQQQQQLPILGCGFQNFQLFDPQPISFDGFNHSITYRQRVVDEADENEYKIHDGNTLYQRQKRMHQSENGPCMELAKAEA